MKSVITFVLNKTTALISGILRKVFLAFALSYLVLVSACSTTGNQDNFTIISAAIEHRMNPEEIYDLIKKGHKPTMSDLIYAFHSHSQARIVNMIIEKGELLGKYDQHGNNILNLALMNKVDQKVLSVLLKNNKININQKNNDGNSPLMIALYKKYGWNSVADMVKAGAEVNTKNKQGNTPLMIALLTSNPDKTVQLLLKYVGQRNLNTQNLYQNTALLYAVANKYDYHVIYKMLKMGADANLSDMEKHSPLMVAAANELGLETMYFLIKYGADVNAQDKYGNNALVNALTQKASYKIIRMLLRKMDKKHLSQLYYENSYTPLMIALNYKEKSSMVKLLLTYGAKDSINKTTPNGDNVLDTLIQLPDETDYKTMKLLVDAHVNVNNVNKQGNNALMMALLKKDSVKNIKYLLNNGADANVKNKNGDIPLNMALDKTYGADVIELLLKHGAHINATSKKLLNKYLKRPTKEIKEVETDQGMERVIIKGKLPSKLNSKVYKKILNIFSKYN